MAGDTKELCLALMRADTQHAVVELLREEGYWDEPLSWRFLGDTENNFSSIGNQQSEAVAALIEKIVNSIDARLLNACLVAGIDPTSDEAPKSIREAVAKLFEDKTTYDAQTDGRVYRWSNDKATAEGRLLTVTATGRGPKDGLPCISIADAGEGQTPDKFPDTFMSLQRSNKLRVHFVQGKFNMGGTGALQFCGPPNNLQLVVSRRNPAFLSGGASDRDAEWGFTIVRRQDPIDGGRSSIYTYLAPVGAASGTPGGVMSFAAPSMPIFPEADATVRDAYAREATFGSLVKLYEYGWQGTKSNIVMSGGNLLRRMDMGLPELALPARVFECRPEYKGHAASFATNLLGLAARLERDKADKLEAGFPVGGLLDVEGHAVRVRILAFKKGAASEYRTARHGVVFHVNGQSHATFPIDLFRRKSVGMGYLADSLLVLVDCSEIQGKLREDLFMNSRDRLRSNALSQRLEEELENMLKNDTALKALRNRRRQEDIANKLSDSKPLSHVLEDLLRKSPALAKLFLQGVKLSSPFPPGGGASEGSSGDFQGKTYPTYFRFRGMASGEELVRDAHLGSRVRVAFETDAADDYFARELDQGTASLRRLVEDGWTTVTNWSVPSLRSGSATLSLNLPEESVVDDVVAYELDVTDGSRIDPFVNKVQLRVRPETESGGGGGGRRKNPNHGQGNQGGGSQLALPNIIEVTEADWAAEGFTEITAVVVKHAGQSEDGQSGEIYDFFVNVDNKFLRIAQKDSKEDPKLLKAKFVYSEVLVGLALLQDDQGPKPASDVDADEGSDDATAPGVEARIERVTGALAPIMLPILESIGALSVDEDDFDDG